MDLGGLGGGRMAVKAGGTQPRFANHASVGPTWLGAFHLAPSFDGFGFILFLSPLLILFRVRPIPPVISVVRVGCLLLTQHP